MPSFRHLIDILIALVLLVSQTAACGDDLPQILNRGVLRHMGIVYGNFVTGAGDGLDVDIVKLFAASLGVQYEFVETNFDEAFGDLIGQTVTLSNGQVVFGKPTPVRGDLLASGLTVLPWRQEIVAFSETIFPTGIWVIARADSSLQPVEPTGDVQVDIEKVRGLLNNRTVLGQAGSCLDPKLYDLEQTGAQIELFDSHRNLNEMVPAILKGEAELTLADAPDALIALDKWPGQIKVIGPLTPPQEMGAAFAKESPQLRETFNQFLGKIKENGIYLQLINKYYPSVKFFYKDYFADINVTDKAKQAGLTTIGQDPSPPSSTVK